MDPLNHIIGKPVISRELCSALLKVWNAIAPDLMQCAAESGDEVSNDEAIESIMDADRLLIVANDKKANDELHALIDKFGYSAVVKSVKSAIGNLL